MTADSLTSRGATDADTTGRLGSNIYDANRPQTIRIRTDKLTPTVLKLLGGNE